jgi:hypothetical protein
MNRFRFFALDRVKVFVPGVALVGGLLAGCPSSTGGNVTLEQLPTRLAPSYCALLDRCDNPFLASSLFAGVTCEASIEPLLSDFFLGRASDAVRNGTVLYRGDRVDACLSSLDAAACELNQLSVAACSDIFEGTVAPGGNCTWDEDCVSGYCAISDGVCPGTCAARIPSGGSCMGAGCDVGLTCTDGRCAEPAGVGELCDGNSGRDCGGIDLTCVGSEGDMPGTCRSWSQILDGNVGDACSIPDDLCDDGLSCVFVGAAGGMVRFECASPVAAGASCSQGFPDPCPDGQFCMMGAMPGMGTCTALPGAGQACGSGGCQPGLRCAVPVGTSMGTCVTPVRLGQSCTADSACVSNSCEDGVCATPGC